MRLLLVSPDYASHLVPLLEIAKEWQRSTGPVTVATGPATRPLVVAAALDWTDLRLGKGNNRGVIEVADQPAGEDDHLRAFFAATRIGPAATLAYQADARRHDLLHDPDRVLDRLAEILAAVRPDHVVVDHVAFGARLALHALGLEPATVVLGHPSALPAPGEVYGAPPRWPSALDPGADERADIEARCRASVDDLDRAASDLLARRAPERPASASLPSRGGRPTIYAYPSVLHPTDRTLPPRSVFVGSLARSEQLGDVRLPTGPGPRVTVAFGSFLSARDDVLATAVDAARLGGWRLAIAHGSSAPELLGSVPLGALVARHLPQVALLEHTDVLVTHGGNASITEAARAGVPMVVLPFSTDQFAGAEAVERAGIGRVLAPNAVTGEELVAAVARAADPAVRRRASEIAHSIAHDGGARRAVAAIAAMATLSDERV